MTEQGKIIKFIVHPGKIKESSLSFLKIVIILFTIILLHLVPDILFGLLNIHSGRDSFQNIRVLSFISAIFIAPFVEEIIFRTHLSGKSYHSWSLPVIYIVLVVVIFYHHKVLLFGFLFFVFVFIYKLSDLRFLAVILRKYYNVTFYVTCIIFSLVHLPMVKNDIEKGLFFSIIVTLIAFFPLAVLLGIIRRKYGLPAAMIFHSLNNIVVLSLNSVYVHYGL